MVKCAHAKCSQMFVFRGPKKYCSQKCSRVYQHLRRAARYPELVRAHQQRRHDRWVATHPEAFAKSLRKSDCKKRHNGLSIDAFDAQIIRQGNRCPIGDHPFDARRGKWGGSPCQDHNHETGQNRGVICNRHNRAIGCFHESLPELGAAMDYLRLWNPA